MNLIKAFVRRPVTTIMMISVFVVLGYVSFQRMVVDLFPEIEIPLVQIISVYPGAGPAEIESQMVKKIEDEVSGISDIKEMRSEISEGYAFTIVRFNLGVDVDIKALDIKDKIEQIKRELPDAAEDPLVAKFDPLTMPVVKVALTSDRLNEKELYQLADEKIKDHFSQLTGVAKVEVLGGAQRQINVYAKPEKLRQYGLTPTDLVKTLGQENLDIPAGNIKKELREVGVRFKGEAESVEEIEGLTFNAPRHGVIRLSDVARIEDGNEEQDSLVRYRKKGEGEGGNAVLLDIYKRSDGNVIEVSDGVRGIEDEVREKLPAGVELHIAGDESEFIRDAVNNALSNIFYGVLLCALVLWVFLRDLRFTFVAAVVIPTSIMSAFLLMDAFNFTVNVLTLSALGVSIGALVANAIVVLENIARQKEQGLSADDSATKGTSQVAVAVMAAGGTNIVVFTPIAFMGGIVGQFFYQFGLTVVFATIFSLLASFSLTPMLSAVALRGRTESRQERLKITRILHFPLNLFNRFFEGTQAAYDRTLHPVLRHPWLTLLFTLLVFAGSIYLAVNYIGGAFVPSSDRGEFTIVAQLPKGSTLKASRRTIAQIESVITEEVPELEDFTSQSGGENTGLDEVQVKVRLTDLAERTRTQEEVMYDLQEPLSRIPGAEIYTRTAAEGPGESDLDIDLYGPDYDKLIELSRKVREKILSTGNFRAVFNTYRIPKDEIHFNPELYKRAAFMVPNAYMGMIMRYSIEGEQASVLRVGGEEYDIKVRMESSNRDSASDVWNYQMATPKGMVPLSSLGKFERTEGTASISRKDKRRTISLRCFIANKSLTENTQLLEKKFDNMEEFQGDYDYEFAGTAQEQQETQQHILFAFILAVILTYMLLAAILNSFVHPLTILVTVPLGMVGVFLALFFSGITLNVMSMMAIVMLVGIVVNNAILIIDYALQKLNTEGGPVADCVQQASVVRFRAVLMASLAIIAGILPQVFGGSGSEFSRPIGVATIGGVGVSLVFTYFTVPALFLVVERMMRGTKRAATWTWKKLSPDNNQTK
ncbi:MAG: efflux RND transporter permease subunit [bacterium]